MSAVLLSGKAHFIFGVASSAGACSEVC